MSISSLNPSFLSSLCYIALDLLQEDQFLVVSGMSWKTALCFLNQNMPLRGEGSCGGGGAPRDSAGSGATEEGLTSRQHY